MLKVNLLLSYIQPGTRDGTIQCFIKRDKSNLTYHLFLCLSPGEYLLEIMYFWIWLLLVPFSVFAIFGKFKSSPRDIISYYLWLIYYWFIVNCVYFYFYVIHKLMSLFQLVWLIIYNCWICICQQWFKLHKLSQQPRDELLAI